MKKAFHVATVAAGLACMCAYALAESGGDNVGIENAAIRLVLSGDGAATSLVVKATGEECLAHGVRVPFARLRQDRPYDNEMHLLHPAKPMWFNASRIARKGDALEIGFANEYHVLRLRVVSTGDYVAFVPEGTEYVITDDFGDKRRTEIDGLEFLRLPVRDRAHFGACANVSWDARTAVAVMGLQPEVRIDGDAPEGTSGWRLFSAGTENLQGLFGRGAAIVADAQGKWLDRVDALERDFDLPRGARNRRDPIMRASYGFITGGGAVTAGNVDEYIGWLKKGGFRVCMISYSVFAETCGHFTWRKQYPNGAADLKKVTDKLRAADITPALHVHYNKVSVTDPYVKGCADPRIASVREVCLAADIGADDDNLALQDAPNGLRTEYGRRLVRFGEELMSYESFTTEKPWKLNGLKRGLYGTPRLAHRRGEYGRHLDVDDWYYFHRIDQSTEMQDEIAGRIANIVDACGFEILYFDGGEDVPQPYWYNVPRAQKRVWDRIRTKPRGAESALKSHFGWHMLSRGNAFDTFYPERTRQSLDKYILPAARLAADDFSTVDFGWLRLFLPGEKLRGKATFLANNNFTDVTGGSTPEQIEMVARAAYENNAPLSFVLSLSTLRAHPQADAIMSVFRKYEDMKFGVGSSLSISRAQD